MGHPNLEGASPKMVMLEKMPKAQRDDASATQHCPIIRSASRVLATHFGFVMRGGLLPVTCDLLAVCLKADSTAYR